MRESKAQNIAITGNIGSGKSTFCHFLEESGYTVHYADEMAQQQMPRLKDTLCQRWGEDVFEGELPNRRRIAEIVFANPPELEFLNSCIHPLVIKELKAILTCEPLGLRFFEIPLLFEAGLQDLFDCLVLIQAPRKQVLNRLKHRNPANFENQLKRLDAQMPDAEKAELVDFVIANKGSREELKQAALELIASLQKS